MSIRVATNVGHRFTRRLGKPFSSKAVGTSDPNTLNSNVPSVNDAMGIAGQSGIITFAHYEATAKTFTAWYWNQMVKDFDPTKGWVKLGPANTVYSESVDANAAGSFTVEEGCPFFLTADAACTELFVGGSRKHPGNVTADIATMVAG